MDKNDIFNDKEFIKATRNKKLAQDTINSYANSILLFCRAVGKPYHEIVEEIKPLQDDVIIGNRIKRYDPNDSLISDYIDEFISVMVNNNNKSRSINSRLTHIRIILKSSNIILPDSKRFRVQKKRVPLLTRNDINFVLSISNIHHKAYIAFAASTGIRLYDTLLFTLDDFIDATKDYHDCVNIDEFIKDAPDNMIGFWEFIPNKTKKSGLVCKVCNSPESSNYLLQSIRERAKAIERINERDGTSLKLEGTDALFASRQNKFKGPTSRVAISSMFYSKNSIFMEEKKRTLEKKLKDRKIQRKEYQKELEEGATFHPHALRHFFISTIRSYLTNRDISLIMEAHVSPIATDENYLGSSKELFSNQVIKDAYQSLIPYLTFKKDISPEEYNILRANKKLLEEAREREKKLEEKCNSLEENMDDRINSAISRRFDDFLRDTGYMPYERNKLSE